MLIGTEKLRRAGDRQAIERIQEKKELISLRKELAQETDAREAAELETYKANQRNMCLTRKADVSNFCMMTSYVVLFVALGLFVYAL